MATSTLTDKGQTTVPLEIRQALKVKPRQRLEWTLGKSGTVTIRPQPGALCLFGSLKSGKRIADSRRERAATIKTVAEHAAHEGLS